MINAELVIYRLGSMLLVFVDVDADKASRLEAEIEHETPKSNRAFGRDLNGE